jgi:hypothetical protein
MLFPFVTAEINGTIPAEIFGTPVPGSVSYFGVIKNCSFFNSSIFFHNSIKSMDFNKIITIKNDHF